MQKDSLPLDLGEQAGFAGGDPLDRVAGGVDAGR